MDSITIFDAEKEIKSEDIIKALNSVRRINKIPFREVDVLHLCLDVIPHYKECGIVLLSVPVAQFIEDADSYKGALMLSTTNKADVSPSSQRIEELDKKIDKNLNNLKSYPRAQFGYKEGVKQFARLGIVHEKDKYIIPKQRSKRLASLEIMLIGIQKLGYTDYLHGLAFWQPIYDEYNAILSANKELRGDTTLSTHEKNQLKDKLRHQLGIIYKLVEINYDEDAEAMLRKWGFQKERYR